MAYGILEVCYNENDKSKGIREVKCNEIMFHVVGTNISIIPKIPVEKLIKTKDEVVKDIQSKTANYFTVVEGKRGAEIEVIEEEDNKYIRTVGNGEKKDNLGELPTYEK